MITADCETTGFCGPAVLIQWAEDDGPVNLHSVWTVPIRDTLELIEHFCKQEVCGFNLVFDWFQICKLYTTLRLMSDKSRVPLDCVDEFAYHEPEARFGPCLKPKAACDVMLHARKTKYQSLMAREDIRVKRVPAVLAYPLARELGERVKLKDIYFAKRKDKHAPQWNVYDVKDEEGEINPHFKDVVLKFNASGSLKALATDALGLQDDTLLYQDIEIDPKLRPVELGYAPYALAVGDRKNWNGAWPDIIRHHVAHWGYNKLARKYATNDVEYTRGLYKFFGSPTFGDNDSELACMVGAVRWYGYNVNVEGIKKLKNEAESRLYMHYNGKEVKIPTAPGVARPFLSEKLNETERKIVAESTGKDNLMKIMDWKIKGTDGAVLMHPAAERAGLILGARQAGYEMNLYDKFILANRFHASFDIIGTLSSRMSGSGGDLNAQGIKHEKYVRQQFPLADPGFDLCGGDFSAFEVCLAAACYDDPQLTADIRKGLKIHAVFGQFLFPHLTYEQIVASAGTANDYYDRAKRAFFATLYGAEGFTLNKRSQVPPEIADEAIRMFGRKYAKVGEFTSKIIYDFCSMRQEGGIGSRITWRNPAEKIESMFGFPRYFTLENMMTQALFSLANKPPPDWRTINIKVQRRDRLQKVGGAVQSALYAAAFAIQAGNTRAARNHMIQSSGAEITKTVQRRIWDIQPCGINDWKVCPFNVHDEIQCPAHPSVVPQLKSIVKDTVESYRERVPLIKMDFQSGLSTWADKS